MIGEKILKLGKCIRKNYLWEKHIWKKLVTALSEGCGNQTMVKEQATLPSSLSFPH